jgi:hypothetical protein
LVTPYFNENSKNTLSITALAQPSVSAHHQFFTSVGFFLCFVGHRFSIQLNVRASRNLPYLHRSISADGYDFERIAEKRGADYIDLYSQSFTTRIPKKGEFGLPIANALLKQLTVIKALLTEQFPPEVGRSLAVTGRQTWQTTGQQETSKAALTGKETRVIDSERLLEKDQRCNVCKKLGRDNAALMNRVVELQQKFRLTPPPPSQGHAVVNHSVENPFSEGRTGAFCGKGF